MTDTFTRPAPPPVVPDKRAGQNFLQQDNAHFVPVSCSESTSEYEEPPLRRAKGGEATDTAPTDAQGLAHQLATRILAKAARCVETGKHIGNDSARNALLKLQDHLKDKPEFAEVNQRIATKLKQILPADQSGWVEYTVLKDLLLPQNAAACGIMMGVEPLQGLCQNRVTSAKFSSHVVQVTLPALMIICTLAGYENAHDEDLELATMTRIEKYRRAVHNMLCSDIRIMKKMATMKGPSPPSAGGQEARVHSGTGSAEENLSIEEQYQILAARHNTQVRNFEVLRRTALLDLSKQNPECVRYAMTFVCCAFQGLCRIHEKNNCYGVPQLAPALKTATDPMLHELQHEYGCTAEFCAVLRARAATSQVEAGFSLVGELAKHVPTKEKLCEAYNQALTAGTGVISVWSALVSASEMMLKFGPTKQLTKMARAKLKQVQQLLGVLNEGEAMIVEIPIEETMDGNQFYAILELCWTVECFRHVLEPKPTTALRALISTAE